MEDEDYDNEEATSPAGNNQEEVDEQKQQQVSGKVAGLEIQLQELKARLKKEQESHERTKALLQKASSGEQSVESLTQELERYKGISSRLQENLNTALALSNSGVSPGLGNELLEFFKFCHRRSFKTGHITQYKDITEDNCIAAIRLVRKGINGHAKKLEELTMGSDERNPPVPENEQIKLLQTELKAALRTKDDLRALKTKLSQMIEKLRNEKDVRLRTEDDMVLAKKKILMLSDHMEKLMSHLRLEATSKLKTTEQLRLLEKASFRYKDKIDILTKKSAAKDRLILELREGSKILEDQLRLMDEKYLELRTKLDWTRENGNRRVLKAEKTAKELRMKFALAGGSSLLDKLPLPEIFQSGAGAQSQSDFMQSMDHYNQGMGISSSAAFGMGGSYDMQGPSTTGGIGVANGKRNKNRHKKRGSMDGGASQVTEAELTVDGVLDKIRRNRGDNQKWTEDKLNALVSRDM